MTSRFSQMKSSEPGIIILGNAGAGKSYICNILIGYDRFKAEFQPEAVTTETEHHSITIESDSFRIYNIPGLVEVNQEQIDRNKKEIMKAFEQSPTSVVLFVWTQIGGRAQHDDVIAFKALNDAYKFPSGSLMFLINDIPLKRPSDYEAKFLTTLTNALKPMPVAMEDTFFLNHVDLEEKQLMNEARSKLIVFIKRHHASLQRKHADIILQSDQLNKMRQLVKKQQQEAERDREAFQNQIHRMMKEYQIAKEEEEKRYKLMQANLEVVRMNAEKERTAQKEERRNWQRQQREQQQRYEQQQAAQEEERRYWQRQQREQQLRYEQQQAAQEEERRNTRPLRQEPVGLTPHTPTDIVFGGVKGLIDGTASGFKTMIEPFDDYINDSDNHVILRAAAAPIGIVSGVVGGTIGGVSGAVVGTGKSIGRVFKDIFGE